MGFRQDCFQYFPIKNTVLSSIFPFPISQLSHVSEAITEGHKASIIPKIIQTVLKFVIFWGSRGLLFNDGNFLAFHPEGCPKISVFPEQKCSCLWDRTRQKPYSDSSGLRRERQLLFTQGYSWSSAKWSQSGIHLRKKNLRIFAYQSFAADP